MLLEKEFLGELSGQYGLKSIELGFDNFKTFEVHCKRTINYMLIYEKDLIYEPLKVMEHLAIFDAQISQGVSYLCIMPIEEPMLSMCTHFNGKSFIHFLFIDKTRGCLMYDKDFYYSGAKCIKKIMDICEKHFKKEHGIAMSRPII